MFEEQWILTAGPLDLAEFRALISSSKAISKSFPPNKILNRCTFKLAGTLGELSEQGELYLANGSNQLMMALPVEEVIRDYKELVDSQVDRDGFEGDMLEFEQSQSLLSNSLFSKLDDSTDSLEGGDSNTLGGSIEASLTLPN
jgi:hypothetical protein